MSTFSKPSAVVALTLAKNSDINDLSDAVETAFALIPAETLLDSGTTNYVTAAGSGNAYTVSMPKTLAAYTDGYEVVFKANHTNTGAATINIDSLGAKSLRRQHGTALAAGDIQSGKIVPFRYNATSGYFEMQLLASGDMTNVETVAGIADDVTTVAGISANVSTVAGIDTEVTTVAGISSDVSTVSGIAANVTTVAGIAANVTTVAGISGDIPTVAAIAAETSAVAAIDSDVTAVAVIDTEVVVVATDIAGAGTIATVAGVAAEVVSVAGVAANVTTVAGISANVSTVAGVAANIPAVAAIDSDVTAVAAIDSDVTTVAGSIADVQTVADMTLLLETAEKVADYTLALADAGKVVAMNKAGAASLTVPTNAAVAFPVGSVVGVYNLSADDVTIAGAGGVAVRNAGDLPQYGECSLRKRGTDEWVLVGDVI